MSRLGKKPVSVPDGVKVEIKGQHVRVEGPQGKLELTARPEVTVRYEADAKRIVVDRDGDERQSKAFHGLTRALINNMVRGVKEGYQKKLEIVGVGYLAAIDKNTLQLRVGYANEVQKPIPAGLKVTCPDQTHILIQGPDKQLVGEFAAEVRAVRKPEPYKGKGIRYDGEQVRRKAGKTVAK
jgi:large subunit ribosomal protein L6